MMNSAFEIQATLLHMGADYGILFTNDTIGKADSAWRGNGRVYALPQGLFFAPWNNC